MKISYKKVIPFVFASSLVMASCDSYTVERHAVVVAKENKALYLCDDGDKIPEGKIQCNGTEGNNLYEYVCVGDTIAYSFDTSRSTIDMIGKPVDPFSVINVNNIPVSEIVSRRAVRSR